MKRVRGLLILLVAFGCAELAGPDAEWLALDAYHLELSQGGQSGVYFLPPLLHSDFSGEFAPDREPVVRICAGNPAEPCSDPVAEFDMVLDPDESYSRVLRRSMIYQHYIVNWKTDGVPQDQYRIFVLEDDAAVAWVDVVVGRGSRRARMYEDKTSRPFSGTLPIIFRLEVVPEPPPPPPPPPPPANGLAAEYFDWSATTPDFATATAILQRVDSVVDFLDVTGTTDVFDIGQVDHFMARWTGFVAPTVSALYTFCVVSDDGVRLWLNDFQFVDNWVDQDDTERCSSVWLMAGQRAPIRLEWYNASGGAAARLYWQTPADEAPVIVPSSALFPN